MAQKKKESVPADESESPKILISDLLMREVFTELVFNPNGELVFRNPVLKKAIERQIREGKSVFLTVSALEKKDVPGPVFDRFCPPNPKCTED